MGVLEGGPAPARRAALAFGVPVVDGHLPGGGLRLGAPHEVAEAGALRAFAGLAALFAAAREPARRAGAG